VKDYIWAFFERQLKRAAAALLEGTPPYAEVRFVRKEGD
jgi:hypothetical protein